ncbi:MAG: transposase [Betaproteobacteria bacterium]|nr:MAG: transposase [Betaproteobacteria bacterium]
MLEPEERFHGSALRKGRVSISGQTYHVTSRAATGAPQLVAPLVAFAMCPIFERASSDCSARLLAWVLMPDHAHWLIELGDERPLSYTVSRLKSASAGAGGRAMNAALGTSIWQTGFYDRAVRRDEDVVAVARYVVANPLRAGLVTRLGDYPWWNSVWL